MMMMILIKIFFYEKVFKYIATSVEFIDDQATTNKRVITVFKGHS